MATITEPSAQQYADIAQNSPLADFGYMAKHPGISTGLAHEVGQETGMDMTRPENLAAVMHSTTYAKRLSNVKNGIDNRFIQRVLSTTPTALNTKRTGSQQEMDAYGGQEQNALNQMRANAIMATRKMEAQQKLSELSDFDAESYKAERLKELNPTSDIDNKILSLRMQAIVAKSALRNELRALTPALRDQALNARMAVFNDAISTLGDIRQARLGSATAKVQDEINSKNQQIHTAKANVESLDSVIKSLEDQGAAGDAIYKIRLERAKAQKALDKAQGSGVPDQEQNIINYLLNDLTSRGVTPDGNDIANAKRIAKETIQHKRTSMTAARGQPAAVQGMMTSTNLGTLPLRLPAMAGETQDMMEPPTVPMTIR